MKISHSVVSPIQLWAGPLQSSRGQPQLVLVCQPCLPHKISHSPPSMALTLGSKKKPQLKGPEASCWQTSSGRHMTLWSTPGWWEERSFFISDRQRSGPTKEFLTLCSDTQRPACTSIGHKETGLMNCELILSFFLYFVW